MKCGLFVFFLKFPLVLEGLLQIKDNDTEITYTVKFFNHCQDDAHRIKIYHNATLAKCVTECGLRPHCEAMNYQTSTALCELFTETEPDFKENGCIHVRQNDIHIHKSPCGKACSFGHTCDISTRNCTVKECINFPTPMNGSVLGTQRDVRTYSEIKCDQKYTHKNGIKESMCTNDGQWNPVAECVRDCGPLQSPDGAIVELNEGTGEGSAALYTCQLNFVHVGGALTRVCQTDGQWNGTEPQCNTKICTSNGICFAPYPHKDLTGYDIAHYRVSSFEACSLKCGTNVPQFRSIEHCPKRNRNSNCFCKHASIQDGYTLRKMDFCHYYDRI